MRKNGMTVDSHRVTLTTETSGKSVTVSSPYSQVIDWVTRYFSPWWAATPGAQSTVTVIARERPDKFDTLATSVMSENSEETAYPRSRIHYIHRSDGTVIAFSPLDQISYCYYPDSSQLFIYGKNSLVVPLARSATRIAREVIRAQLVTDGWSLLHASAVVLDNGRAILTLGDRGAGKTTVAFTLAAAGAGLLANDRVFARPCAPAGVELLPWPSGAAVGLGLMESLNWAQICREHLVDGVQPPASQDQRVTDALLAGRTAASREDNMELKAHIRPEEFTAWYGLTTASSGHVATVLFPRIRPGAVPSLDKNVTPEVRDGNFMVGAQEDSYPDIFGLTGGLGAGSQQNRADLATKLATLPCHSLVLGYTHQSNATFLSRVVR